jgi:mono/diheme cytochrome c family protein
MKRMSIQRTNACVTALLAVTLLAAQQSLAGDVRFNRDIRPILSDNCFACHGPDEKKRKADLRLDTKDGLFTKLENGAPVVPGDVKNSELLRRVTSHDEEDVMPPPKTGKKLTPQQIDLLRRWVEQGGAWEGHWSFIAPVRPEPPKTKDDKWGRKPLDAFILTRHEAAGLKPSREADKVTLIRRLTFDLTGLPPTPPEVDAFVNDASPDAYEKRVDRLLASPRYGERVALDWLDAARFADTHGYHIDAGRDMTRWREWVIDAFNRNKPYDKFTVEQIAGDLLPDATLEQKIASGFNRNHMVNFEGGAIEEEYRTAYVLDRVNTTGTVWLGLTVACTQCHDHKYDPISQKEYYQLFAFFNNVAEKGLDGRKGNAAPLLVVAPPEQQKKLDELADSARKIEGQLKGEMPEVDAAQAEWEKTAVADAGGGKVEWAVLDPSEVKSKGGATLTEQSDGAVQATGENPLQDTYTFTAETDLKEVTAIRLEALADERFKSGGPGRSDNGNIVLTEVRLAAGAPGKGVSLPVVKIAAASADFGQQGFPVAHAIDGQPTTGWAIYPEVGKPHEAVFETEKSVRTDGEARLQLMLTLEFRSPYPQHQLGRFRVSATGAKKPRGANKLPENVAAILAAAPEARSDARKNELRAYYRDKVSPEVKRLTEEVARLRKSEAELREKLPSTMVMQEMPQPRETFMLVRGEYDKKGERVTHGVPAFLPPMPKDSPGNRLGLATWLVDPAHPLTARVAVNRYWQMLFGTGIVKTAEDFGSQGELPSHPELLDWLAVEFRDGGWEVKRLIRLMVTSATYRQSSAVTRELLAKDPENRLLARAPRQRLQAEFIRDQALAVSGVLDPRIGGKSVSPYQPPGLWEELMSRTDGANWTAQTYVQDHGPDLYRRTMYTFWKRTSPPPTLATFDAPDRETCTVRRATTNTPLQALVLMNDPTYVEASRKLAERMMKEAGASPEEKIAFAFRLATARKPSEREAGVLRKIYDRQVEVYRKDDKAALKLLSVGESPRDEKLDAAELAAWATVASVVLNLDETVTKG